PPSQGFIEHADVGQPFPKPVMPGSERNSVTRLDASGVAAVRVNVQIRAYSDLADYLTRLWLRWIRDLLFARALQCGGAARPEVDHLWRRFRRKGSGRGQEGHE